MTIPVGQLGLGYDLSKERHADMQAASVPFLMRAPSEEHLQTFDPRPVMWRPSQLNMNSCDGHGGAQVAQLLNYLATGKIVHMSRMWCYLQAQAKDPGGISGDHGASVAGFAEAAKTVGVCREETFPYPDPVQYVTRWPEAAASEARQHLIRNSSVMRSYEDGQHWLGAGVGGIHIGIPWTQALAMLRGSPAIITAAMCAGYTPNAHALALVGLSTRKDSKGRHYFWLNNSHGLQWGDQGCAEVEPAAFLWWIQNGAALLGLTDMQTFGYRTIPSSHIL